MERHSSAPIGTSDFLQASEITETRAFVRSFVKAILVGPGRATIPTPPDRPVDGADAADVALSGRVMGRVRAGGPNLTVGSTIFEVLISL